MEIWKPIKGFARYQVSNKGRIKGNSGRIVCMRIDQHGYVDVSIWKSNSKKVRIRVHRLVAETFLDNPNNKPYVNHKNGIKTDNRLHNLEWVTAIENVAHYHGVDDCFRGEMNASAVLRDKQVVEIRDRYKAGGITFAELARQYNVGETTISRIVRRSSWQHL